VDKLKAQQEDELRQLRVRHDEAVARLTATHRDALGALEGEQRAHWDKTEEIWATKLAALRRRLEETRRDIAERKVRQG